MTKQNTQFPLFNYAREQVSNKKMENQNMQFPLFNNVETVIDALGTKIFSIIFKKRDGTERKMLAKLIPSDVQNIHNDDLIRCLDVIQLRKTKDRNKSWRQFDVQDIIEIKCQGRAYSFK